MEINRKGAKQFEGGSSLLDLIEFAWRIRGWFAVMMTASLLFGLAVALLTPPTYSSSAIIAPKEPQKGLTASGLLSQLGGASGMVQALGMGSTNLAKLELIVNSLELSEVVIREHDLLPVLYPKSWDPVKNEWRKNVSPPSMRKAAEKLRSSILSVMSNPRQNVITIGVAFGDSVMSARIVEYFIEALNRKIREDVIAESEANRAYLDSQIVRIADPALRQKIHELIGFEIEKAMLVSTKSVEVLIKPAVPIERLRPRRKAIMITSFFLGVGACGVVCVLAYFLRRNLGVIRERFRNRGPTPTAGI